MGYDASQEEKRRFTAFTKELAELSKKHGIVISATGGVYFAYDDDKELKNLTYMDDATSGDLYSRGWGRSRGWGG